jgi:hypothetical protein
MDTGHAGDVLVLVHLRDLGADVDHVAVEMDGDVPVLLRPGRDYRPGLFVAELMVLLYGTVYMYVRIIASRLTRWSALAGPRKTGWES